MRRRDGDVSHEPDAGSLVYAAIAGWRRQMVEHGHDLVGAALDLACQLREDIELIPDVQVLDDELLGVQASHELDRLQVLIAAHLRTWLSPSQRHTARHDRAAMPEGEAWGEATF